MRKLIDTINELIGEYPKTSFIIVSKIMWVFGFMFTIYVIDDHLPTLRQFTLASIYVLLTLPVSYWLTYSFSSKSKE